MTQPVVKDGFFAGEMLARRNEFPDAITWLEAAFARAVEKNWDLDWFFKDASLPWFHGEVAELAEAIQKPDDEHHVKRELGDVLWWVMATAQRQGISFREALDSLAQRWLVRQAAYDDKVRAAGFASRDIPEDLSRQIWAEVKKELKVQEEAH